MSQTLEQRVEALEKRPGPRGPAGDISAAVRNAEIAASKIVENTEARVGAKADASYARFADEVSKLRQEATKLREEANQLRKHFNDLIQNTVDASVIKTLQDYLLLDANNVPTYWGK